MRSNYSWAVLGISGSDPSFLADDGSAQPAVTAALHAFAAGRDSEQAALTALAGSRLLVPVVAVRADQIELAGKKSSEMALPKLIGLDGRAAIPAFTSVDSMRKWQRDARPVPAHAQQVWQAAAAESCAVIIDVAGPVPLPVEGARLAALARGEEAPDLCADADVRAVVADVVTEQAAVAGFELRSGGTEQDLVIALTLTEQDEGQDVAGLAAGIGNAIMARLGARLRRGIAIWLGGTDAPAS